MAYLGLADVRERIAAAATVAGRSPAEISLVAVSKNRSDTDVLAAYEQGQRVFGENRQQGLAARVSASLPDDIEWHFIGHLQGRKASFVATHATLLHSFDRTDLIRRWEGRPTPVLLQFNMAAEPQKGGFDPANAAEIFETVSGSGVQVRGVMAIPPIAEDPESSRRHFVALRELFEALRANDASLDVVSMGMSNDYEVAIEEGATMVRVGTAIFGSLST